LYEHFTLFSSILNSGVTSHCIAYQSMISISDMKKILGGDANQNPQDST